MKEIQNQQLNLPPLYVPKRTEPVTVKKEIIHLGRSLSSETLPEHLKDNPAFTAHLNRVVDMQKQKMQVIQLRRSAAPELIQEQLPQAQQPTLPPQVQQPTLPPQVQQPTQPSQVQQPTQLHNPIQSTNSNGYHYQNAWDDQTTMNSVVSFDFRIEPVQNAEQSEVVSKEEQLAIATRFLSKLDRVIAQSKTASQV